jgi:hypothetical protein
MTKMSKEPGTLVLRVTANNAKDLYRILQEAAGLPSLVSLSDETSLEALEPRLSEGQTLQAIGRLPGGVAHDVNNMLSVIVSSLELLLQAQQDSERFRTLVERSIEAALKSAELMQGHGRNSATSVCGQETVCGGVTLNRCLDSSRSTGSTRNRVDRIPAGQKSA